MYRYLVNEIESRHADRKYPRDALNSSPYGLQITPTIVYYDWTDKNDAIHTTGHVYRQKFT